ncbi:hypothetical protein EIP86_001255 [Pleurotus ostreatoroseus]|nr:hypothetical protein EIP86_001255 [Pleurotus ostreatoroseus]
MAQQRTVSVTTKAITGPGGSRIHVERRKPEGTSPQRSVLLIHGLGGTVDVFYPIYVSLLSAIPDATLLSFDWPGHGASSLPAHAVSDAPNHRPLALADLLASIEAVIASEAPNGPISIIAHSAGSLLALSLLDKASLALLARLSHAAFLGGPMDLPFPPEVVARQQGMAGLVASSGQAVLVDALLPALTGTTTMRARPLAAALVRATTMGQSKEGYAAGILAFAEGFKDATVRWETLPKDVRLLVIGGSEDQFVDPSSLGAIANKMGAQHATVQDVGHSPMIEDPETTTEILSKFLSV